jgi:tetratricopeptide (TPR) repeat protein
MDTTFSAEEHFREGHSELERGRIDAALEHFRAAHRLDPTSPRYRSYFGLCLGLGERRFDRALELCRSAAKEEFFNPALYHNLARLHLAFGFKSEGIRFLRRGLMIDPQNGSILGEMRALGIRRKPVLGFLRRGHVFNRWFGRLRSRGGAAPGAGVLEAHGG